VFIYSVPKVIIGFDAISLKLYINVDAEEIIKGIHDLKT
jgi:hypothetical protein